MKTGKLLGYGALLIGAICTVDPGEALALNLPDPDVHQVSVQMVQQRTGDEDDERGSGRAYTPPSGIGGPGSSRGTGTR